jgi:hypothetical protein
MTSTPDESLDPAPHPLDEPKTPITTEPAAPAEPAPVVARQSRGLGVNRHLGSVVLSCLAVLGAYAALDYGFYLANVYTQIFARGGNLPDRPTIALGVAAACLLVAAGAGRISGLGPLVAALILGAAPSAWVFLDFGSFVRRLDDVPEIWDNTTFGLSYLSFGIFPAVGGLLLGAAIAGRWRRPAV